MNTVSYNISSSGRSTWNKAGKRKNKIELGGIDVWYGLPLREDPMLAPVLKLLPLSLDTYTLPNVLTVRK